MCVLRAKWLQETSHETMRWTATFCNSIYWALPSWRSPDECSALGVGIIFVSWNDFSWFNGASALNAKNWADIKIFLIGRELICDSRNLFHDFPDLRAYFPCPVELLHRHVVRWDVGGYRYYMSSLLYVLYTNCATWGIPSKVHWLEEAFFFR